MCDSGRTDRSELPPGDRTESLQRLREGRKHHIRREMCLMLQFREVSIWNLGKVEKENGLFEEDIEILNQNRISTNIET